MGQCGDVKYGSGCAVEAKGMEVAGREDENFGKCAGAQKGVVADVKS